MFKVNRGGFFLGGVVALHWDKSSSLVLPGVYQRRVLAALACARP